MRNVPVDRLRELFAYDPASGVMTWIKKTGHRAQVGAVAGSLNAGGYAVVRFDGVQSYVHRIAWALQTGAWPAGEIDHIDGARANNRWTNLRQADHTLNMQNLRRATRASSTGLLGAQRHGDVFRSFIRVPGGKKYLGTFAAAIDAHNAYVTAKRDLHAGCTL
jgi:hypothetical protein